MIQALLHIVLSQTWTPAGIHAEMYPVAQMESSFGQNVNHAKSDKGELWTAVGALGIKPVTAFESLRKNGYDGSTEDVAKLLKSDQRFYNRACVTHWNYLRSTFSDLKRVVYAWRWGLTAASQATEWQVAFDMYVLRYFELLTKQGSISTIKRKNDQ